MALESSGGSDGIACCATTGAAGGVAVDCAKTGTGPAARVRHSATMRNRRAELGFIEHSEAWTSDLRRGSYPIEADCCIAQAQLPRPSEARPLGRRGEALNKWHCLTTVPGIELR